MTKTLEQIEQEIVEWAENKGLLVNPDKQLIKMLEETGELAHGHLRNDMAEILDSAGDVVIPLTIYLASKGLSLAEAVNTAWAEVSQRKGTTVDGTFIKEADSQVNQPIKTQYGGLAQPGDEPPCGGCGGTCFGVATGVDD